MKSKLKAQAKAILNEKPLGFVFEQNTSEYNFLLRIFQGHPEYQIKAGSGISNIYISKGLEFSTRCFFITRIDGSTTDISYIRSIDGATSKISDIKCACRSAVKDVVERRRLKVVYGETKCPISGDILYPENTHIDHYNLPFNEVCDAWLKSQNIDIVHSCLNDNSVDHVQEISFASKTLKESFITFHNANTRLRAVSKTANLSTLKKRREKN
ncbi:DCL family protein [Pedobacter sp. KBW01]|uniref:DCL family protein n=1 Tax=Pedobacter sp. KBW01 TaxID=2153364 RepID=UPI001319CA90|nr:DCL family protein [Pedobacter sp. KBW01]